MYTFMKKDVDTTQKTIFHGSEQIIKKPRFHGGDPHNDYGHGLYCTESEALAMEWAVTREHDGYANAYRIRTDGLSVLEINKECSLMNWMAILLKYRTFNLDSTLSRSAFRYILDNFLIDLEPYDILTGYRADDSYFSFAQDFLNNTISYEQLGWAMRLGYLGDQFVIRSKAAFSRLEFLHAAPALREKWLPGKELRDQAARNMYLHSDRMGFHHGELYIIEMLDKEMKNDDPRLR